MELWVGVINVIGCFSCVENKVVIFFIVSNNNIDWGDVFIDDV